MTPGDIIGIAEGKRDHMRKRYCDWFHSRWFRLSLGSVVVLATWTGVSSGAPLAYVFGQIALGLSVYVSLFLLANRPLINPIQAVVAIFYWWFGVGPAVTATWNVLIGKPEVALTSQVVGMDSLWVVAPGLILYAIVARLTLQWFSKTGIYAQFLLPAADNYRPKVLLIYVSLMGVSTLVLLALRKMGIQGQVETSFLGGTKTTIWWVGVIGAVGLIAPFVSSALMRTLVAPWKTIPRILRILIFIVIAQVVISSLLGGWKSPLAILGAYYIFAYVFRHQKPPWTIILIGIFVFLVFITPFVMIGRGLAITEGADNSAMRKQVFVELIKNPQTFLPIGLKAVDVSIFFRGIYPLAGELTRRNDFIGGEWHGHTIFWGLETLVPRAIDPNKPDQNIGNLFSQTVGADIGISSIDDNLNSLAISIPFEFVGNFGWGAGILSFAFIGFFWTLFICWLLSPARLASHPLAPFLTLATMGIEAPFGAFAATMRDLIIPLLICYFVYRILNKNI